MQLLTPTEVAEMLRLSRSKVYELKEKIGFLKIGGAVRFRSDAVVRFLEGCEVSGNGRKATPSRVFHLRK